MIMITGEGLSLREVTGVAREGERVEISPEAVKKIERSREMVERLVSGNKVVYGITTGFGNFSDTRISPAEVARLQENLIMSHAAGTGEPLPEEVVRAMMLLRINALARGYSGIRLSTIKLLIEMLNQGITPWTPEQGSVGASGDLVPLAHMALVMIGQGEAYLDGELIPGAHALEEKGLKPVKLASKEGLALINGTQMMGALGVLALSDSENLALHADLALALSLEALQGLLTPYKEQIHLLRPHPGQIRAAQNIRALTRGSRLSLPERADRVQDAYSLRCAPQVHGASRDALDHVRKILEREINSVTDNPLLFPDQDLVLSGGNFHGQPLALGLDYLGMAVSELGNISERRIARLTDSSLNNGLEPFLTRYGGLNSGYMIAQYTAASLVSENKVLANPASTDSIPTSANQEDHVSMGSISARKVRKIVENVEQILAAEFLTAAQGINLRTKEPERVLGEGSKVIFKQIREVVPELEVDRPLYPELKKIKELIHSRTLLKGLDEIISGKS